MEVIFYIITILGISGILTFLAYKLLLKIKSNPISIPNISFPKINLPKIKLPNFKKKPMGQIMTITSVAPLNNIFQEDLEIEYANGEYKRAVKKQSAIPPLPLKSWMVGVVVLVAGVMVFYYMKKKR